MKKGVFLGLIMILLMAVSPAWAESVDSSLWLRGDYIGVGGIDMPNLTQRRIFTYLMDFFNTDSAASTAFKEARKAGVSIESIKRIVVGIPADVEKSEHIILWEMNEDIAKYRSIVSSQTDNIITRNYKGIEYYATKRDNECMAILDNVFVLGSELRVKEILESYKTGYKKGVKRPELAAELKRVDKSRDAWLVFALNEREKQRIGMSDPVVDMTDTGLGTLRFGEIRQGSLVMSFSSGLSAAAQIRLSSNESAAQMSKLLNRLLQVGINDQDVQALGFSPFLSGIAFDSKADRMHLTVTYDQSRFDELIAIVTQLAKSVSPQKPAHKAEAPAAAAP